eukprot:TRINITY_DN572_c0_g3_i1.p1 TRINITY_DN572_c0_g3~~TRINITY_DN572_c0_g3_i1.p1  ORF type:complete len:240 (+),score=57.89 TRINITY_DN572_c0_g3_i1:53-772(+)
MHRFVVAAATLLGVAMSEDVPVMNVPNCAKGKAMTGWYYVSTAQGMVVAQQKTRTEVCWDADGWSVMEMAEDKHVFSPYETCNSNVWEMSDVMETFMTPVEKADDAPEYYYEMDATPTGAFFAAVIDNPKGNASYCALSHCTSGNLPCTGKATFPAGMTVTATANTTAWSLHLRVPWSLFAAKYQPSPQPWPVWRANFYRYDYPDGPNANYTNYELSAWSPTHNPSFHIPSRFGVLRPV